MLWIFRMAWRESRASRRKLLFFSLVIAVGIAALVSVRSFRENLERAIQEQSKTLLGADLVVTSRQAWNEAGEELLREIGGEQSREVSFSTMVYFQSSGESRLVQARALEGDFPYYGAMDTHPAGAREKLNEGAYVLLEESLFIQFGAEVGQKVRLGERWFRIAGALRSVPGESMAMSMIAPRVYLPADELEATGLLRYGSLARYRSYIRLDSDPDEIRSTLAKLFPKFEQAGAWFETVEGRQRQLGRAAENLQRFFGLAGFVALLLGAIGVSSAIHIHVKAKVAHAAVLRCLGASSGRVLAVYLVQAAAMGIAGALAGAALGLSVQVLLHRLMAEFLPFDVPFSFAPIAVAGGMSIGFVFCLMFGILPLLPLRNASPLSVLRRGPAFLSTERKDPLRYVLWVLIGGAILWFSVDQTGNLRQGLSFFAGLGGAFVLLAASGYGLMFLARRFPNQGWPYSLRQGMANLHRPNNRTILLLVTIGLGSFLILTLYLSRDNLLRQVLQTGEENRPDMALFDIQDDEVNDVAGVLESRGFPVRQIVPVVTMRLASINGTEVDHLLNEGGVPRWVLQREYRSTYRSHLVDTERLIRGEWSGGHDGEGLVNISLEEGIAGDLAVDVGDRLVFDVQGIPVETVVGSIREVDWRRIQPNFFVVFPEGVLEEAPKFHVMVTRAGNAARSAEIQRAVVETHPGVSIVDLSLILDTLDRVLGRIAFVIRFMAMFTVATGLLVLAAAIMTGRYQRVREAVLLRTLGASRQQIRAILLSEYLSLGVLASILGIGLSIAAAWALARFSFQVSFALSWTPLFTAGILIVLTSLAAGWFAARDACSSPPLEVLRRETD